MKAGPKVAPKVCLRGMAHEARVVERIEAEPTLPSCMLTMHHVGHGTA